MIKRGIVFIFLLSLFPLLFSCSSSNESTSSGGIQHIYEESHEETQVTGINIASNYIELVKEAGVDLHYNISAVVQPENADNKTLLYTSSNPEIAEVSSDGNVTVKDFGMFNVKIQSESRADISQQVDFYVRENIKTALDMTNNPLSFFGAYSISQYGIDKEPDTNIGGSFSINVDRAAESTVNAELLFNGLNIPLSMNIDGLATISYEEAGQAIFSYLGGSVKDEDTMVISLKADDNTALIDNGLLQAGQTLYLALNKDYDLVPGQSHVEEVPVSVTQILVSEKQQIDRLINTTHTITPVVEPVNASNKAVTYSSSNEQVATVSPTGVVIGLNSGSADIIVTSVSNNEVIGKTAVTVIDSTKRVEDIVFSNTDTNLLVGSPVTVQASAVPSDATYNDITYYSKNPTVATVNSATGVVTPRRVGTVEIAAVSDKGSFEKSITLNVGISEQTEPVRGIINIPSKLEVSIESQTPVQLNGQVVPTYADDTTLTYKADESGCVSVDENGLVSALKVGTGIVTVSSSKYPDIKKEVSIAVRQNEEKIYVTSINVNQAPSVLYIGHTSHTITPTLVPANTNMENELTVTIDDKTVASLEQVGNGYKVTPLKEGSVIVTLQTANGVTQEVPLSVKKVMNVKGYYTISKVEYTLGTKTETFTAENDKLQGEFAIDLLADKYTIKGRLQFTPKNPLTSYTFNNWRYLYENKEIMLDTADKYSSQTKEVLASQNINITSGNTIEYTYTKDSLKAVVYLTKVNDNTKDILDRTMYITPVNMASDPHSAEGYYEMTWFYGNSLNTAMLERYPAIYSSSKDEMPTSSDIGITYHKECPDPTAWYDWSACYNGGGGANGSVTNYSGAFAVKVDGTEENAQITSIAKVQMQGHQNFNLSSWLKYIHATFDPLTLSQSTASDGKIVSQNLNARIITNSEDEGSQGAYLAYTQLNNNQMQFEMQFLTDYKFMYRATKVSDRYVDLPTDKYASGDISGRNPPTMPELAQVVPVTSFTGTVTPIEE